ncbi:glycerol-3-phosphate 1-O-acyltransferase PlsY [Candidatus Auribacterota bacterium]
MLFLKYFITLAISYLIGSIPTAFIMGKLLKGIDLREHGSGNLGATNALRVLGKKAGSATLAIDMLKGMLSVALLPLIFFSFSANLKIVRLLCCITVIFGHIWTLFLKFKGGKGIATSCGAFLSLTPLATLSVVALWLILFFSTHYVSLGSVVAAFFLPIFIFFIYGSIPYTLFAVIIAFTVILKHKANISRLLKGTENKIEFKKKT